MTQTWLEQRARVTFFLPAGSEADVAALHAVIEYLRRQQDATPPVSGFTCSHGTNAVFHGHWWGKRPGARSPDGWPDGWIDEEVALFVVDYAATSSSAELRGALTELRRAVLAEYERRGSPQTEVWIAIEGVLRLVAEK